MTLQAQEHLRSQYIGIPGISLCGAAGWLESKKPGAVSQDIVLALDLLKQMLEFFQSDRISATDALAHPFFASIRDPASEVSQPLVLCPFSVLEFDTRFLVF